MTILPTTLDYSDRDFESIKLRLQGLVQSVFPEWTDFNIASYGNLLVELFSYVGDILNFYQDNQAAEAFWPTLVQRISAIRLSRLFDFTLSSASSATADLTFSIPAVAALDVSIPSGTRILTTDPEAPLTFRVISDSTLTAGLTSVDVAVEQAEMREEIFDSNDMPSQELVLTYTPFLDGSLDTVTRDGTTLVQGLAAANGDYAATDTFLGKIATDKVFTVIVDQLDRAHIRFGNGVNGEIPQGEIQTKYKVGGGIAGNVDAGRITNLEAPLFYSDASLAPVSATNVVPASGGADRMTLDEARAQAPASLRVLTRTITKSDFETVAKSVSGVARALMATSNEYAGITENYGHLYIVAQGEKYDSGRIAPASSSLTLRTSAYNEIMNNKPPTITFDFEVFDAVFLDVDLSSRIYLERGASETVVSTNIRAALYDFFAVQLATGADNPDIDFGANLRAVQVADVQSGYGELAWSDIFNVIRDIDGVRKVDEGVQGLTVNTGSGAIRQSAQLAPIQFPRLTGITLINADTGLAL
jgi:hypothetical protein